MTKIKHKIFVKICGITNYTDALHVCKCGADAIGFIAYPKSKRYVDHSKTVEIIKRLNYVYSDVLKVGVFVNAKIEQIIKYIDAGINVVQLHGDETAEDINELRKLNRDIQLWKAVKLKSRIEIDRIWKFDVDKVLVDTYSSDEYGGTGKVGNWQLAEYALNQLDKPVILAGGLNPGNVRNAINSVMPYGIDLSSGVELCPGLKDHNLISELFKNIQNPI